MPAVRWVTGLGMALVLTACSGSAPPPAAAPAAGEPARQGSAAPAPGAAAAVQPASSRVVQPAGSPAVPEVLARPATQPLQRVPFKAGDEVSAAGIYFLNTVTGSGEAWLYPGVNHAWIHAVSDDNRFVILTAAGDGYVIDRQSSAVWRWDPERVRPLLADARGFLFAEVGRRDSQTVQTGRFFWSGPDFKPRHVLTLDLDGARGTAALLSPDGRHLALLRWGDHQQVAWLDLDSGDFRQLDAPPLTHAAAAAIRRFGEGFQVEFLVHRGDPGHGPPRWHSVVRRFNWRGEPLRDLEIPGNFVFFSPDGKWVAWEEWIAGGLVPATLIADADTLLPRLQAPGTTPCFQMTASGGTRWLADSSGLVVDTAAGYRLLTLDGQLREPPAFAGLTWKGEPQPAPDHPDRFAIGRLASVNRAGTQRLGVTLQGHITPAGLPPWGATSAELRFSLPPPARDGACGERPPMPARVLLPARTLPAFPLAVRKAGSCVELRDRPHGSGRVLACLPDGSRLAAVRVRSDIPALTWVDQGWWLSVETETGQSGWVSLKGEPVGWALP